MIGFTFRNIHSSALNVIARNIDRTVVPRRRKNKFVIPGRHGTIDYGEGEYEERQIIVELGVFENTNLEDFRKNIRDIAKWLSGSGLLIFDDEPDKAYQASVNEYIGINPYIEENYVIEAFAAGTIGVVFECQPFAESLEYRQVNIPSITANPYEVEVNVSGTAETCCIITIKNNGTSDINNITLVRKVEV